MYQLLPGKSGSLVFKIARAAIILIILALQPTISAMADGDSHKSANHMEKRQAIPLKRLIRKINRQYPSRILSVKLEKEKIAGSYLLIYEVKILTRKGSVLELYYNALNLKLVKSKGYFGGNYKTGRQYFSKKRKSGYTKPDNQGKNEGTEHDDGHDDGHGEGHGEGHDD